MCESRAIVSKVSHNGEFRTYFVSVDVAFSIARCSKNYVVVFIGSERYRFFNGEPILTIVRENFRDENMSVSLK